MIPMPRGVFSVAKRFFADRFMHTSLDTAAVLVVTSGTILFALDAYWETDLGDAETTARCRYPPTSNLISSNHVREIEQRGFTILTNVLTPSQLREAQHDIATLLSASSTTSPNRPFWSTLVHSNDDDVRSDSICWVRESDGTNDYHPQKMFRSQHASQSSIPQQHGDGLFHAIKLIRGVGYCVEQHAYFKSHSHKVPQQCQLSRFAGGGGNESTIYSSSAKEFGFGYRRHLDKCDHTVAEMGLFEFWRASDYRGRALTVILYLNDVHWNETNGGALRCFHDTREKNPTSTSSNRPNDNKGDDTSNTTTEYTDVVPRGGTMIIFDASRVEHAVLPSTKDRFALTCWLNGTTTATAVTTVLASS